eukprot:1160247-Pelagomonas_calceolata.AAC.16
MKEHTKTRRIESWSRSKESYTTLTLQYVVYPTGGRWPAWDIPGGAGGALHTKATEQHIKGRELHSDSSADQATEERNKCTKVAEEWNK